MIVVYVKAGTIIEKCIFNPISDIYKGDFRIYTLRCWQQMSNHYFYLYRPAKVPLYIDQAGFMNFLSDRISFRKAFKIE